MKAQTVVQRLRLRITIIQAIPRHQQKQAQEDQAWEGQAQVLRSQ